MKLLSVSLGNRRGEIDIESHVEVPNKTVTFRLFTNRMLVCEGPDYHELREIALDIVALNTVDRERMT